jgi:hypothetical protein
MIKEHTGGVGVGVGIGVGGAIRSPTSSDSLGSTMPGVGVGDIPAGDWSP